MNTKKEQISHSFAIDFEGFIVIKLVNGTEKGLKKPTRQDLTKYIAMTMLT